MRRVTGFTLIELLVVITIIVVLLALLAPALDRAIGAAMEAKCLSNLRQIGVGLRMYTGDFHGHFPPKYQPGTTSPGTYVGPQGVPTQTTTASIYWWVGTAGSTSPFDVNGADKRYVNPYLGYAQGGATTPMPLAQCPAEFENPSHYATAGTSYASNHSFSMSSLLRRQTFAAATDDPIGTALPRGANYGGIKITQVLNPSRLVAGGDSGGVLAGWNWHASNSQVSGVPAAPGTAPGAAAPAWHRPDTYSLLFVDTHASMIEINPYGTRTAGGYTFDETGRE